jgi:hypothetical protein
MTREIELLQIIKWKDQACSDSVAWMRDINGVKDTPLLNAYTFGFSNGFMKAYLVFLLHDLIKGKNL